MAKYDYLNNYLNSNMNKYKRGGMLTQYNVGGTHEQNPNGGIPIGPDATVEQGETSMNVDQQGTPVNRESSSKYIFSEDSGFNVSNQELKARGLPPTRKDGESFASYSKRLTKPFEGREGDRAASETKKEFLARLAAYHEEKKAEQAAMIQQAMAINAQQNQIAQGPAPEGYPQEFQEQQMPEQMPMEGQQMMYMGGAFSKAEAGNLTAGNNGIASTMPNAKVNFYTGGLMRRRYDVGGMYEDIDLGGPGDPVKGQPAAVKKAATPAVQRSGPAVKPTIIAPRSKAPLPTKEGTYYAQQQTPEQIAATKAFYAKKGYTETVDPVTGKTTFTESEPNSKHRRITGYQPGVQRGSDGMSGMYIYTPEAAEGKEFIYNKNIEDVHNSREWKEYQAGLKAQNQPFLDAGMKPLSYIHVNKTNQLTPQMLADWKAKQAAKTGTPVAAPQGAMPVAPAGQPIRSATQPMVPAGQPMMPTARPVNPMAQPVQPAAQPVFRLGGRLRYEGGGYLDRFGQEATADSDGTQGTTTASDTTSAATNVAGAMGGTAGAVGSAATGVMDLYSMGKGNTSTNMGKAIGGGALKGAAAGASIGSIIPGVGTLIGGAVGAVVGAGVGYFGGKRARKKADNASAVALTQANTGMPGADAWAARHGGYITRQPAAYNMGGYYATGGYITRKAYQEGGPYGDGTMTDEDATTQLAAQYQARNAQGPQLTTGEMGTNLSRKFGMNPPNAVYGYDANAAHNVQRGTGLNPGPWGPKSRAALRTYQGQQGIAVDGSYGKDTFGAMGLTPGGRQYLPQVPVNAVPGYDNPQVQQQPNFAKPQQGPELPKNWYEHSSPYFSSDRQNSDIEVTDDGTKAPNGSNRNAMIKKAGEKAGQYATELGRYSPVLSNFLQREQISKPTGVQYARLSDAYNVPQMDEARQLRDFNAMQANKYRAIGSMGGSQAQQRAMMTGVGAQGVGDLSKIYEGADAVNREQALQKLQYQNQIAQYNAGAHDRSLEAQRMDEGNYETQRSKFTGQIGTDLGQIAKERTHMNQVAAMYGYDWNGKYMIDRKTGKPADPAAVAKIKAAADAQTAAGAQPPAGATPTTVPAGTVVQRMGGYITKRKAKY